MQYYESNHEVAWMQQEKKQQHQQQKLNLC